jgi:hypothetical protein
MEVAGLAAPRPEVSHAALKFAARSESTAKLTINEREALEEFVKVLVEVSDDFELRPHRKTPLE